MFDDCLWRSKGNDIFDEGLLSVLDKFASNPHPDAYELQERRRIKEEIVVPICCLLNLQSTLL